MHFIKVKYTLIYFEIFKKKKQKKNKLYYNNHSFNIF